VPNLQNDFDNIEDPSPNTCVWICDHPMYRCWIKSAESCTLHLAGKMGCGKSVLTKHVLKSIRRELTSPPYFDDQVVVLFYFCSRVNRPAESATILLGSLIYQLLVRQSFLFRSILQQTEILDSSHLSGNSSSWSLPSLWKIFIILLAASPHSTVYIFIDALDECDHESTEKLLSLYRESHASEAFRKMIVKLFISSQQRPHILDGLHKVSNVNHLAVTPADVAGDIHVVLNLNLDIIKEQFGLESDEIFELQHRLATKADGMFQWASIALNELRNADDCTLDSLLDLVNNLPPKLGDLYNRALQRSLNSLPKKDHGLLKKILVWILLASRPLTVAELTIGLAISPDDTVIPPRRRRHLGLGRFISKHLTPFVEIISSHSNPRIHDPDPFVCLKDPQATIRPVHQSAKEFLFRQCLSGEDLSTMTLKFDTIEGHEYITRTCLVYFRSKELQLDWLGPKIPDKYGLLVTISGSTQELDSRLKENELLAYAAQNWAYHLRHCESQSHTELFNLAVDFLVNNQNTSDACLQIRQFTLNPERPWYWPPASALAAAVRTRSSLLVELLLSRKRIDIDTDNTSSTGTTALMEVCSAAPPSDSPTQSARIVEILLEAGADALAIDNFGRNALHYAAANGMLRPLELLLTQGVGMDIRDRDGATALFLSILFDESETTRILLSYGADSNIKDNTGTSPLHLAVINGHIPNFELLLSAGANINTQDEHGNTPLCSAIRKGDVDIAMLLLDKNANVSLVKPGGLAPIHWAATMGQLEILRRILELGASVNSIDAQLRKPLHLAAFNGYHRCCELLLQKDTAVDSVDEFHKTPLMLAALGSHTNTIRCLLEHSANPSCLDHNGTSLIHIAAKTNNLEILHAMYDFNGGELSIQDKIGWTSLHYAARDGSLKAVHFLSSHGMDVNQVDKKGRSALHLAAAHSNMEVVSALLDHGAKYGLDDNGWTPLDISRQYGFTATRLEDVASETAIGGSKKSPTRWNSDDKGTSLKLDDDCLTVQVTLTGRSQLIGFLIAFVVI